MEMTSDKGPSKYGNDLGLIKVPLNTGMTSNKGFSR